MKAGLYQNRKDGRIVKFSDVMLKMLSKNMDEWRAVDEVPEEIKEFVVRKIPYEIQDLVKTDIPAEPVPEKVVEKKELKPKTVKNAKNPKQKKRFDL